SELRQAFAIHRASGSCLGGVHFELTGENVTECLGGARNLVDSDLKLAYRSEVDPRLNYEQSLEMAMLIARMMGQSSSASSDRVNPAGDGLGRQATSCTLNQDRSSKSDSKR